MGSLISYWVRAETVSAAIIRARAMAFIAGYTVDPEYERVQFAEEDVVRGFPFTFMVTLKQVDA